MVLDIYSPLNYALFMAYVKIKKHSIDFKIQYMDSRLMPPGVRNKENRM